MYHIIFDLEMTLWATHVFQMEEGYVVYDKKKKIVMEHPIQEIIEIGAVKLNEQLEIIDTFNTFVKPRYCPITAKCTSLTGITQQDVEQACQFRRIINEFAEWINDKQQNFQIYSWSDSDRNQIIMEAKTKQMQPRILEYLSDKHFINLQKQFSFLCGRDNSNPISLKKAMQMLNIDFEQKHRALDDALATASILTNIINTWKTKIS